MNYIVEIRKYFHMLIETSRTCAPAQEYYQWQLNKSKPVTLTPWKKLPKEARSVVAAFLDLRTVKPNLCYNNAYELVSFSGVTNNRFGYVEGWAHNGILPIAHGWNSYTAPSGKVYHFDLTAEILFGRSFGKRYMAILNLDFENLAVFVIRQRAVGEFVQLVFRQEKGI